MYRIVYGVSDWPESHGETFPICAVLDGESDAEAIARAKSYYSDNLEVVII